MGNNKSICDGVGLKRQLTILVVGLDNSGKTCTSRALVGDVTPTIGFSKFVTKYKGILVNIYDLGGSSRIREIWHNYFAEAYGVVFVIDASDSSRLTEAKHSLSSLMKNPILKGKPLLLLANKQDHLDALDEIDVAEKLDLELLANQCQTPTRIEICSAIQGTGKTIDPIIRIGFHWLIDTIIQHYEKINDRVTSDVALQREKEEKERDARKERLEKLRALQNHFDDANISTVETTSESQEQSSRRNSTHLPESIVMEEWHLPGTITEEEKEKVVTTVVASELFTVEAGNSHQDEVVKEAETLVEKPQEAAVATSKKNPIKAGPTSTASKTNQKGNTNARPTGKKGK